MVYHITCIEKVLLLSCDWNSSSPLVTEISSSADIPSLITASHVIRTTPSAPSNLSNTNSTVRGID